MFWYEKAFVKFLSIFGSMFAVAGTGVYAYRRRNGRYLIKNTVYQTTPTRTGSPTRKRGRPFGS
jgi:hypothetical protein